MWLSFSFTQLLYPGRLESMQGSMQQHTLHPQQQQAVLVPITGPGFMPATQGGMRPGYASRTAMVTGMSQILMGVAAIIIQAILIGVNGSLAPVGHGIWCGVLVRQISYLCSCCTEHMEIQAFLFIYFL